MIDIVGRTVLITGSTDGVGRQTAQELAAMGAHVFVHGRDPERVRKTVEEIQSGAGKDKAEGFVADFCSLSQVKSLADEVRRRYEKLDILINNAAVYMEVRQLSADGFEMTFAVNHLAPFLLTAQLLEPLRNGSPSRIVNVSSRIHSDSIDFDNLQGEKAYNGQEAYCLSKLCNILFTYELAERLYGSGVTANCLTPGVVNTKLLRGAFSSVQGKSIAEGAQNLVYVATAPELKKTTGKYYTDQVDTRTKPISYDRDTRKRIWVLSEKMIADQNVN
jgi:NAD(P)-dependent dehydrogenase (short-subunit alcohol dehydrogenase family)